MERNYTFMKQNAFNNLRKGMKFGTDLVDSMFNTSYNGTIAKYPTYNVLISKLDA